MNRRRRSLQALVAAALLQSGLAASSAAAPTGDVPGIATPGAAAPTGEAPGIATLAQCAAIATAGARLACYDALAGRPAAGAVPPLPPPDDPQNFGVAQVRVNEPPKGPAAIQAHVARWIDDGLTHATVVLDNGQTWAFAEAAADASLSPGDAVVIKRALLGSFLLVTPSKHSYHVHRIR